MPSRTCRHGAIWSRCGREPISSCVYCGRAFCDLHGRKGVQGLDVCDRPRCEAKIEDLSSHSAYLEAVDLRNKVGICGAAQCQSRYEASCSSCQRFFCDEHVRPREDAAGIGDTRYISACDHCWARRKLWRRRG